MAEEEKSMLRDIDENIQRHSSMMVKHPQNIEQKIIQTGRNSSALVSQTKFNTKEHPNKYISGKSTHRVNPYAVNHELRKKLWDGQIPVKINLHHREVSTNKRVRSLYMMAYRLNYLVFLLEKIKSAFDEFVAADTIDDYQEMWIEYNGQPLRWDVPIGVQFDTLIGFGDHMSTNKSQELPWQLVFHYKGCPDIVKLQGTGGPIGIRYINFSYINSIKESHVLRMGSANEILTSMKKSEEEKLLDGIQKHNYELFWQINQPLCEKHVADMKKFAIRIFSNNYGNFVQPSFEIEPFQSEGGSMTFEEWEQKTYNITIGEFLEKSLPKLFKFEFDDNAGYQDSIVGDITPVGQIKKQKSFDIICHGLEIDLSTPLYWLQLNMSYLDNFVYISLYCY